jgi:hypothetical protein
MPTYTPYTPISSLPANSQGERTILTQHIDNNLSALADMIEGLLVAVFASGGVIIPGTVTNPSGATVRVQGRLAITEDGRGIVTVGDQSVSLEQVAVGTRCRVVITAAPGETTSHAFTDVDTQEALTHTMMRWLGRLEVREGDATNYPTIAPADAYVARVTRTSGGVTIDEIENPPPTPRGWFA